MPNNRFALLVICSLSAFLTPFMGSSINLALPLISKDLSMHAIMLGWVPTAYTLSAAMFLVPFGRIADIKGRELVFKTGMVLFTLFSLISAFAITGTQLIVTRFLQGIGGAMIFGTSTAILTASFPVQERGRVLGLNIGAVYLGISLGPVLGGLLTQHFGWHSIFLVNAGLGGITAILAFHFIRNTASGPGNDRFDLAGSIVYGFSLVLLMLGLSFLPAFTGAGLVFCGLAGLFGFGLLMSKSASPVLNLGIFRGNTAFLFSNLAALINYSATAAVGFLLSLYLQFIKGYTPQHAGMVLVIQPVIMTVFVIIAGRLSDTIEPRVLASLGMGLTAVGLGMLIFVNAQTPVALVVACLVFLGLGFAFFSSPNTNAVMSSVDKPHYGVASAVLGTMRLIGMMLSMGVIMVIFSVVMGRTRITPEYYVKFLHSMHIGCVFFTVVCSAGVFASLARGNVRARG